MLRITTQEKRDRIVLKLEGDLAGTWVVELENAWRTADSMSPKRLILLDLIGINHVDSAGRYLLALLKERKVRLIVSGVVMTDLVASIGEDWQLAS